MGFGFNYDTGSGADIVPIVKYDARAGRLFRIDRKDGVNTPTDITRAFRAVIDLENVEVGWMNFNTGGAPHFALVKLGQPFPARPTPDHKQGVRVMMRLGKECGGDVREMASVAKAALRGLDVLHDTYDLESRGNPGKLPIVALKDTIAITSEGQGQKSTNYQPVFEIVGWAPRPVDLVFKAKGSEGAASRPAADSAPATPPSTGSTRVDPPAAREPAMAEDDFG